MDPLEAVDHRSFPPPARRWVLAQRWHDLLFAHWPLAPDAVRATLAARGEWPAGVELDTFDGRAWVGVVPFRMSGVRLRGLPPLPGAGAFPELNVRTYVTAGGKPGVLFQSLDAASRPAVRVARAWFRLPYFDARMRCEPEPRGGGGIAYASERTHRGAPPAELVARYRPTGPVALAAPGTLEHWLTERYCLYVAGRGGRTLRGEIHHVPWPLQPAEAELERCTLGAAAGFALDGPPASLCFARELDVRCWSPVAIGATSP